MDETARQLGVIAELAIAARSLREFDVDWFAAVERTLGFDTACAVWSGHDGAVSHASALGYSEVTLETSFPRYMAELTAAEVAAFTAPAPAVDFEVLGGRRREELTVYRELLVPLGVSCFVTHVWRSRRGVFGFHLGRTGGSRRFTSREVEHLGALVPCIKLGQALLARPGLLGAKETEWWAAGWCLSRRELEIARLVARGFSNPEIATMLRVSPHTVRNHLVPIFRKADVSTRAELVFAMNAAPELVEATRRERLREGPWRSFVVCGRRAPRS
ncbi:MAG TPA: helix-turn-helix transcriptional regulator [Polyangiaceae bacterium]|jgi:DNA-binding CsgD family transcriptional regulator|nr:helix-turn-helix transcriptional regulator [Polyangiaceae bacterium]